MFKLYIMSNKNLEEKLNLLKKQQDKIEKMLNEQKKREQLLKDNSTIEKLEFLIKPLSSHLDEKEFKGNSGVTPIYGPSIRDDLENKYKDELIHSLKKTRKVGDRKHIPIKKNILLNEEIFITIMNILKKQQEEIEQLKNKE
jgi:hypothetical protein